MRAQTIVDVMGIVRDIIGNGRNLRLETRKGAKLQIVDLDVMLDRRRNSALAVAQGGAPIAQNKRSVMLHEAFERLPRQIQSIEFGVRPLERSDYAQGLGIVIEASAIREASIQRALTGMTKGWMAKVVRQRQRFREILVDPKRPCQGPGNLRDLERMGEPGAKVVAFVKHEHLRLVREPTKRRGMDDAVAIPAEYIARGTCRLGMQPTAAPVRIGRIRGPWGWRRNYHAEHPIDRRAARTYLLVWP